MIKNYDNLEQNTLELLFVNGSPSIPMFNIIVSPPVQCLGNLLMPASTPK